MMVGPFSCGVIVGAAPPGDERNSSRFTALMSSSRSIASLGSSC
jgi:hypothetical protein